MFQINSLFILYILIISCVYVIVDGRRRLPHEYEYIPSEEALSTYNHHYYNDTTTPDTTNTRKLVENVKDPHDHLVTSLPGLPPNAPLIQYAGHLYNDDNNALFYWLFEKPTSPEKAPLIIWLNGGPGCSSMDGLFLELGPLRIKGTNIELNEFSWHHVANLVFVDQPYGTGLSFTKNNNYAANDRAISENFKNFLTNFFKLHDRYLNPEDKRTTREIYFTGESHAGHYIPSMVNYLLKHNENAGEHEFIFNVKGLAIGNGWIEPYYQYDVSDFAHGMGIISNEQKLRLKDMERECQSHLAKGQFNNRVCFNLLDDVIASTGSSTSGKMVIYDSRMYSKQSGVFPPGHQDVEHYLNRKDVRQAIHASACPITYQECTDPPYFALTHQDGLGVSNDLIQILNAKIDVLLYSGQYDVICQHLGTEKVLGKLKWNGIDKWLKAGTSIWVENGNTVGYVKASENLQHLVVLNAHHMVPMAVPRQSLAMIDKFIRRVGFGNGGQGKVGTRVGTDSDPSPNSNTGNYEFLLSESDVKVSENVVLIGEPVVIDAGFILHFNIAPHFSYELTILPGETRVYSNKTSVKIDGLTNGQSYFILLRECDRIIDDSESIADIRSSCGIQYIAIEQVTPGCVHAEGQLPCCGHGTCRSSSQVTECLCQPGYGGEYCQLNGDKATECLLFDPNISKSKAQDGDLKLINCHLKNSCQVALEFNLHSLAADYMKTDSVGAFSTLLGYDLSSQLGEKEVLLSVNGVNNRDPKHLKVIVSLTGTKESLTESVEYFHASLQSSLNPLQRGILSRMIIPPLTVVEYSKISQAETTVIMNQPSAIEQGSNANYTWMAVILVAACLAIVIYRSEAWKTLFPSHPSPSNKP